MIDYGVGDVVVKAQSSIYARAGTITRCIDLVDLGDGEGLRAYFELPFNAFDGYEGWDPHTLEKTSQGNR